MSKADMGPIGKKAHVAPGQERHAAARKPATPSGNDVSAEHLAMDKALDLALEETFPASDPPRIMT